MAAICPFFDLVGLDLCVSVVASFKVMTRESCSSTLVVACVEVPTACFTREA